VISVSGNATPTRSANSSAAWAPSRDRPARSRGDGGRVVDDGRARIAKNWRATAPLSTGLQSLLDRTRGTPSPSPYISDADESDRRFVRGCHVVFASIASCAAIAASPAR
jgi:hypothetical protein